MTTPIKTTSMKRYKFSRQLLIVALAVFLAACSATTKENEKQERLKELRKNQAELAKEIGSLEKQIEDETPDSLRNVKAKQVEIAKIATTSFDHYVQTQGLIESENNIQVSAKTMGVVEKVFVKEGQLVGKGQVIAQIDNSVIQTSIAQMKSQLELANTVYERQKNLWDQKIGTEVQFLQAKTNKESLEKQLAALQEQNEMTRIKSPISGTVDDVNVKVGENISPGMPAARIVNSNDLKLVAKISEAYVSLVQKGNTVRINVPELKKDIEAKVTFVGRNIDPLSRTFTIEVDLKSKPELRPNMTAIVKVIFNTAKDALVVPVNVVQTLNNEKVVYVAEKKGKDVVAKKKVVTVEGVYNNQAQVKGLEPGDQVITFGYQGLNDGEVIKI
jgi:RND family efflux transporter MFP subunit